MKKVFLLLALVACTLPIMAEETNLLENGDFEEIKATTFMGVTTVHFEGWDFTGLEELVAETNDVYQGKHALKVDGSKRTDASLAQDVSIFLLGDAIGQEYELTIHYKVLEANEGDLYLNSRWTGTPEDPDHDTDKLQQVLPNSSEWKEFKVRTSRPQNGNRLRVSVGMNKGVKVLFDDFSLIRVSPSTAIDNVQTGDLLHSGDIEIYTLSGQRIDALQSGVNIIRQGSQSYKVIR